MASRQPIELSVDQRPILVVLIDVEEEFDWTADFDRSATAVTHVDELVRGFVVFEPFGIVPIGVVSYPVANSAAASERLRPLLDAGRMVVGAHLHPWVNPPFVEDVNAHNSFPGNLDPEVEAAKLLALTDRIEEGLGVRPRVYQAGRYGIGPNTPRILERAGYQVSTTINPPFDFTSEGGPDFSNESPSPFWFGEERPLLEIPVTGAFIGSAGVLSASLHRAATSDPLKWTRLGGILSRLGVVERIRLSPEGHSASDMKRLTRCLMDRGVRVFLLTFHSPTLKPGCTSYVRNEEDRTAFLRTLSDYFEFFLGELGGESMTPLQVHTRFLERCPPPSPVKTKAST